MKWNSEDITMFIKERQYIDTVVMPLYPVSFGDDIKQSVGMTEFISLLSIQLERQFKGRLLMLPGFSYLKNANEDKLVSDIKHWETELLSQGFSHVFYVTSDSNWKIHEENLEGNLIWLPSLPLEQMDEKYKNQILEDQVKQLLNLFVRKWQNNE
ncbi:YpiF family protein [Cytobacillus gottheilii]|uniref:YpiF family protein n=1 Tax=Cytobacillus gottheilii TaxID=859144 RepID=UPI0009BA6274|nr:YpiF family protein [Cytobacillus gottheilii]